LIIVTVTLLLLLGSTWASPLSRRALLEARRYQRKPGDIASQWLQAAKDEKKELGKKSETDEGANLPFNLHHVLRGLHPAPEVVKHKNTRNYIPSILDEFSHRKSALHVQAKKSNGPSNLLEHAVRDYGDFRIDAGGDAGEIGVADPGHYFMLRDDVPNKRDEGTFDHEFPEELEALVKAATHRRAEASERQTRRGSREDKSHKAFERLEARDYPFLQLGG
jgi:hypothetical protein